MLTSDQIERILDGALAPIKAEMATLAGLRADTAGLKSDMDKIRKTQIGAGRPVDHKTLEAIEQAHIADNDPHKGKGLGMGRYVRCMLVAQKMNAEGHSGWTPEKVADKILKDADFAQQITEARAADAKTKGAAVPALGESSLQGGGALVPTMYAADLIEFLRPIAIVRASRPLVIPLPSGNLTLPKQTSAAVASYEGENVAITPSTQNWAQAKLAAKKIAALTPISNDLLRDSNPAVDILVRNDLGLQLGLGEDLAFIRGTGTGFTPLGVRYGTNSANILVSTQASTYATLFEVTYDLLRLQGCLEDNNVPLTNLVYWMHPRSKRYLMSLRDGVGHYVFMDEIVQHGTLLGHRLFCTTQIPINLAVNNSGGTGSGSASEVYFGSMDQFLIGDNLSMEVTVVPNGAYDNGSGTIISGLSNDQTIVRVLARHDCLLRHDYGFGVLTGVAWIA